MKHRLKYWCFVLMLLLPVNLILSSCGIPSSDKSASSEKVSAVPQTPPVVAETASSEITETDPELESKPAESVSAQTVVTRDSTPQVLVPAADGITTYGNSKVTIDASHTSEGYVMVNYTGTNHKPKLQLTGTDQITYTYNLHGGYETFPLTTGNGTYKLVIYENISGNQYSTAYSQSIDVTLTNEFNTYLYPNQYVNFTSDMQTVRQSADLAKNAENDLAVVANVYNYVVDHITYDYNKADTVQSGYLPVVDTILSTGTGICFDYAAVMATMLRVQRIPTRLEVGYRGDVYHAWVSVYIADQGWINGIIQFDGSTWKMMDPTFASTSKDPTSFTVDQSLYLKKYIY